MSGETRGPDQRHAIGHDEVRSIDDSPEFAILLGQAQEVDIRRDDLMRRARADELGNEGTGILKTDRVDPCTQEIDPLPHETPLFCSETCTTAAGTMNLLIAHGVCPLHGMVLPMGDAPAVSAARSPVIYSSRVTNDG